MIDFNIDNYLRISWQDVLLVCISSLIIVLICKRFFWDKLLAFVNKRQAIIQQNIDSSTELKAQAQDLKHKYEEQISHAGQEASKIIDDARNEAEVEKEEIIASARQQAANIERSAQEEIAKDRLKAQNEMKDAITDVAIAAAGQILEEQVDAAKQKEVVDRFIAEAGEGKW